MYRIRNLFSPLIPTAIAWVSIFICLSFAGENETYWPTRFNNPHCPLGCRLAVICKFTSPPWNFCILRRFSRSLRNISIELKTPPRSLIPVPGSPQHRGLILLYFTCFLSPPSKAHTNTEYEMLFIYFLMALINWPPNQCGGWLGRNAGNKPRTPIKQLTSYRLMINTHIN